MGWAREYDFERAGKLLQWAQVSVVKGKWLTRHYELELQTIARDIDIDVPINEYLGGMNELCISQA